MKKVKVKGEEPTSAYNLTRKDVEKTFDLEMIINTDFGQHFLVSEAIAA
jgi:hypothetical protein